MHRKQKQLKRLRKVNQNKYRLFKDCDFLKAWRFFKITETNDYRYLIDSIEPVEYDPKILADTWDKITTQFDKIKGTEIFKNRIKDIQDDLEGYNNYIILKLCLMLMLCGDISSLEYLDRLLNIKFESISLENIRWLRNQVLRNETKLNIKALEESDTKDSGSDYVKSVIAISSIIGRHIDKDLISVTEYIHLENEARKIIEIKKSHGKNYKIK